MAMGPSADIASVSTGLEARGFHVFYDFLDREQVEKARQEITKWLETDLRERQATKAKHLHTGRAGKSDVTKTTHILLDAYAKSPALDQLVERILSDPLSAGVLKELAGEHIKFPGYNIQKITGYDPKPSIGVAPNPHEWHRDSPGEIGIALFLEDVPGPNNGATSLVPGSHYFPYCPRWNCLFGPPYLRKLYRRGFAPFLIFNLFSRILAKRVVIEAATGAYGKQGDFYFFINDVWHGREPNTEGRTPIKVMIGAFPSDMPFPDKVVPPDQSTLMKLPPLVRRAAAQEAPASTSPAPDTILKRVLAYRRNHEPELMFKLAQRERKFADFVSAILLAPFQAALAQAKHTVRFLIGLQRKEA
jgi:Phytanoyl-CoA dioxygenase (PhyH)